MPLAVPRKTTLISASSFIVRGAPSELTRQLPFGTAPNGMVEREEHAAHVGQR